MTFATPSLKLGCLIRICSGRGNLHVDLLPQSPEPCMILVPLFDETNYGDAVTYFVPRTCRSSLGM